MKGGQSYSSNEMNDLQKFLKKLVNDYNKGIAEKVHNNSEDDFNQYMAVFGKNYTPEEMEMRKAIFKKNKERMKQQNELFKKGESFHTLKLNHLSDRTVEEVEKMMGSQEANKTERAKLRTVVRKNDPKLFSYDPLSILPSSFDWRLKNYVTSVKNQGECNSCYAFAALGALEAYYKQKTGNLISLSAQNILDCTWDLGNNGCTNGYIHLVFDYTRSKGVSSEYHYPYTTNASHNCRWQKEFALATHEGYRKLPRRDEMALKHAVFCGPVATGIGIGGGLEFYNSGVFQTSDCGPLMHAVLIVGYGTDPMQGDYWIVKDSSGEFCCEDGYVRFARNKNNVCGLASQAYLLSY